MKCDAKLSSGPDVGWEAMAMMKPTGPLVPSRLCYHAGGLRGALHHGAPWATQDRAILHHLQGTAGHKMLL